MTGKSQSRNRTKTQENVLRNLNRWLAMSYRLSRSKFLPMGMKDSIKNAFDTVQKQIRYDGEGHFSDK